MVARLSDRTLSASFVAGVITTGTSTAQYRNGMRLRMSIMTGVSDFASPCPSGEASSCLTHRQERGVQGARIHDMLHAHGACLAGSQKILTRDGGFSSLGEAI